MKTIAYFFVCLASLFCFVGVTLSSAAAADYLGDVCWQLDDGAVTLKLGFSSIGGGHLLVNGRMSGNGITGIVSGNAEVEGDNLLLTVVHSGRDKESMWTSTSNITINLSTLNGTYESIGHDRNYKDLSVDTEYETGSLTFIRCPPTGSK